MRRWQHRVCAGVHVGCRQTAVACKKKGELAWKDRHENKIQRKNHLC